MNPRISPPVLFGVFLASAATLLSEILWVRIFSVAIWYHFAFFVVSVALLGFGVSGILLRVRPQARFWSGEECSSMLASGMGVCLLLAYWVTNLVPFSPFEIFTRPIEVAILLLYYIVLTLPFVCFGLIMGLILTKRHEQAGLYYAADLLGAGAGVMVFFFLIRPLGAERAIAVASLLGFSGAFFLPGSSNRRGRAISMGGFAICILLLIFPALLPEVRMDSSKAMSFAMARGPQKVIHTEWNRLSRVDVIEGETGARNFMIDGGASSPLSRGTPDSLGGPGLANRATAAAFSVVSEPDVLIIGSGGGLDVRIALVAGAAKVTAVEINPTIVDLVRGEYNDHLGHLFRHPAVQLVEDEGRHVARERPSAFDVVQLTLIDTWAASASGAYSLSENYLYTVEAIQDYMNSLKNGGVLSITRWDFEVHRLLSVIRAAVPAARTQTVVLQRQNRATVLVRKGAFTSTELDALDGFCERSESVVRYSPRLDQEASHPAYYLVLTTSDMKALYAAAPLNLKPATDDNPFFFQRAKWNRLRPGKISIDPTSHELAPTDVPAGEVVLLAVLGLSLLLSVLFLIVPLVVHKEHSKKGSRPWAPLLYFSGLGVAFILLEIVSMQRFSLYLGHPSYAIIVVMFSILVASGIGSALANRLVPPTSRGFERLGYLIGGSILAHLGASLWLFSNGLSMSILVRVTISVVLLAVPAFFMGMAFPAGVRALGLREPRLISWGWAMNGTTSVVGSSLAVLGAMIFGLQAMVLTAAGIYVLVMILFSWWLGRSPWSKSRT